MNGTVTKFEHFRQILRDRRSIELDLLRDEGRLLKNRLREMIFMAGNNYDHAHPAHVNGHVRVLAEGWGD